MSGRMTTIWITGAAGFLGGHAVRYFARSGHHVVAFPGDHPPPDGSGPQTCRWIPGPLAEATDQALEREVPDIVLHAAGGGLVAAAALDPLLNYERTVVETARLLDRLRRTKAPVRVLYPSSAAVYGNRGEEPLDEKSPCTPVSVYGWHKLGVELLLSEARSLHGLTTVAIRFFSLYGPGLRKQVLWDWTKRFLGAAEKDVLLLGGREENTRDFLFIDDALSLLDRLVELPACHLPQVVNGGSGTATRLAELAALISDRTGGRAFRFDGAGRAGDPAFYRADTTLAHGLGSSPPRPLEEGLDAYLEWAIPEIRRLQQEVQNRRIAIPTP